MTRRNRIKRNRQITSLALGFAAALAIVSSAQAAQRPDDRTGTLGVGAAALDRSDVVSRYLNANVYQHSPGVGTRPETAQVYQHSPGVGTPPDTAAPLGDTGFRPDNRAGSLGVDPITLAAPSGGGHFSWGDAGAGLGAGFALALMLVGGLIVSMRTTSGHKPRSVAAA